MQWRPGPGHLAEWQSIFRFCPPKSSLQNELQTRRCIISNQRKNGLTTHKYGEVRANKMDDRRAAHNALVLCAAMQKQDPFAFLNSAPPAQHSLPAAVQRPGPGRQGPQRELSFSGRWHDVAFLCLPRGKQYSALSPRPSLGMRVLARCLLLERAECKCMYSQLKLASKSTKIFVCSE